MEESHGLELKFVLAALVALVAVVFFMVRPYLALLILAAILAVIFEPLYRRIKEGLRSPSLAALITTLVVLALVLMPLVLFGYQLIQEAAGLYGYLAGRTDSNGLALFIGQVQTWLHRVSPGLELDTTDIIAFIRDSLGVLLSNVGFVFAGFARAAVGFILLLFVFFYLVRDGEGLIGRLIKVSPLSDRHEKAIIATLSQAVHSVVRGSLVIALIQGLVAGIGFSLFGVPNPVLWAGVSVVVSFVPTLGTALVQVPVIVFMYLTGNVMPAVGLALWALFVVGLIDNFLRPQLISRGTGLHPLVMLLAILGGITLFGPIGLVIGPIVMSLTLALADIWLQVLADAKEHSHRRIKIHS